LIVCHISLRSHICLYTLDMHSSFVVVIVALASCAMAVPMASYQSNSTTPHHNVTSTTSLPPVSNTTSVSTSHSGYHTKPVSTTTFTTTDFITTTKFVPISTPVATSHGTTFYSTFLTTEVVTSTSCYPVTSTIVPPPFVPTTSISPKATTTLVPPPFAPACATETVTVYPQGGYYQPGQCDTCQTITYTDVSGYIITIAVPTNPWHSESETATGSSSIPASTTSSVHITTPASSTTTHKSHASGSWTKSTTKAVGTGNLTTVTSSTSTSSTSSVYGTGKAPTKPYPTGNWA